MRHLTIYALCWLADWADARGHVELTRWADNRINGLFHFGPAGVTARLVRGQ